MTVLINCGVSGATRSEEFLEGNDRVCLFIHQEIAVLMAAASAPLTL